MQNDSIEDRTGSPPTSGKPRFSEVCQMYNLDYQAMQEIASHAGLPKDIVDAMSVSRAVRRAHALKILTALSKHTGQTWTLENVHITLLTTFKDLHAFHEFDQAHLSTTSSVSFDLVGKMLRGEPVPMRETRFVLQAASRQTRHRYTLDNVDVQCSDEG